MCFLMRKYSLVLVSIWHGSLRIFLFLAMPSFCKDVNFVKQKNFFFKIPYFEVLHGYIRCVHTAILSNLSFGKKNEKIYMLRPI